MSDISSAASASASSGTAAHRSGHGGSRQGPTNLFSNLLSMVSASRLHPLTDGLPPGTTDTTETTGAGSGDNPLSDLLGWMDQAQDRNNLNPTLTDGEASSELQLGALLAPDTPALASASTAVTQTDDTVAATKTPLAADLLAAALAPLAGSPTSAPAASASSPALAVPAAAIPVTTHPEASSTKTIGAATSRPGGVDITGMRPVAPGTALSPAQAASLSAKSESPGTTTTETVRSAGIEPNGTRAVALPGTPSAAAASTTASTPAPAQSAAAWTATVPSQSVAVPSTASASPSTTGESGPDRARALPHANRSNSSGESINAQTATASSTAAPPKASTDTAPGTPSLVPTPASSTASSRSAPAAQDRTGKATPAERSTVALDERFARSQAEAATLRDGRTESTAPLTTALAGSDAPPQNRTDLAPLTSPAHATDTARATDARGTNPAGLPSEAEPTSVSHWSTQHLRHASLRVGEGTQEAIDIQLSMDGKELNVDFRTDSAEARATLSQHADQSLGSLLERSGIQLGGVSVGAQQQQGQPPRQTPQGSPAPSTPTGTGQDSGPQAPGAAPRGQLAARQDTSRPLDLFV